MAKNHVLYPNLQIMITDQASIFVISDPITTARFRINAERQGGCDYQGSDFSSLFIYV
jgi:hypothetical protein